AFYCTRCGQMATTKTCPHGTSDRVALSGTEVRKRLSSAEEIPPEFSRSEVASVLRAEIEKENTDG
ncbi:MAG: sulfate adenylyltransferase, partial [Acidimicrobiia bacterium]